MDASKKPAPKKRAPAKVAKTTSVKTTSDTVLPTPPPAKQSTPLEIVEAKYKSCGWVVIRAPKNSINDLIVSKDEKMHYVQVVTPITYEEPRYHGESKNNFIQNAFSNNATPIIATVTGTGTRCKVTLEDVNILKNVIIMRKKAETKDATTAPTAPPVVSKGKSPGEEKK